MHRYHLFVIALFTLSGCMGLPPAEFAKQSMHHSEVRHAQFEQLFTCFATTMPANSQGHEFVEKNAAFYSAPGILDLWFYNANAGKDTKVEMHIIPRLYDQDVRIFDGILDGCVNQ